MAKKKPDPKPRAAAPDPAPAADTTPKGFSKNGKKLGRPRAHLAKEA
jgi:hypothetical protein